MIKLSVIHLKWVLGGLVFFALGGILMLAFRSPDAGGQIPIRRNGSLIKGSEARREVELFLMDTQKQAFRRETVFIFQTESINTRIYQVVEKLLFSPEDENNRPISFDPELLIEVYLMENGTCVVDMDSRFRNRLPGGTSSEYQVLYSLVKTLIVNFDAVKNVRILVNGESSDSFGGHLDISEPLNMNSF